MYLGLEFKLDATYRTPIPNGIINALSQVSTGVTKVLNKFESIKQIAIKAIGKVRAALPRRDSSPAHTPYLPRPSLLSLPPDR